MELVTPDGESTSLSRDKDGDSFLGAVVRLWIAERVSPRVVRYVAVAALAVLGVLAVLETLGILVD